MNKLTIIGNLTRDPELRQVNTQDGTVNVCDFSVAVNRRGRGSNGQNEVDFFRVTTWRGLAENCSRYLAKGRKVAVVGEVSCRTYTGSNGVTYASMEVRAEDVEFLTPRQDGQGAQNAGSQPPAPQQAAPQQPQQVDYQMVVEDDLPF